MTPLFFGTSDKPLFGVYHPPTSDQYKSSCCLICNPVGHEYNKSHNALHSLANRLSKAGFAVLRFDYYGTGDSSGESDAGNCDQWLHDIDIAAQELRDMSGEQKINIIGLRAGALLCAHYAESQRIDQLLLWDPVIDGNQYIDQLTVMQKDMLIDADRFDYPISIKTKNEFLGSPYSTELQKQLRDLSINSLKKIKAHTVHIFTSSQTELDSLEKIFSEKSKRVSSHKTEEHEDWNDILRIEDILLSSKSIQTICDAMSNNNE